MYKSSTPFFSLLPRIFQTCRYHKEVIAQAEFPLLPTDASRARVYLHDELHVSVSAERRGRWVEEGGKGIFSPSRNNPIPREDEPNLQPAALSFTTMKRALQSEVAEERPPPETDSVCVCVWIYHCVYCLMIEYLPFIYLFDSSIFNEELRHVCFLSDHTFK